MNKLDKWLDKRSFRNIYTIVLGFGLVFSLVVMVYSFIITSSDYDNLAREYAAELETQKESQGIVQYYHKLSPAMRAYLYDLQNYRSSARVQYVQYFGWKDRDVLIGIEHNIVNDTYYGIWGINGSPDYNLERGEAWNQDVFIHYVE